LRASFAARATGREGVDRLVVRDLDQIMHVIDCENTLSQAVARRLGAEKGSQIDLFGHVADVWVTRRDAWTPQSAK
jgi:hypothetical protein